MAQPGLASLHLTGREGSRIHWLNRHVGLTGLTPQDIASRSFSRSTLV